jgi:hypothetical protein
LRCSSSKDNSRVIPWHINGLGVGWLDLNEGAVQIWIQLHSLSRSADQCPGIVGIDAQPLHGVHHRRLIRLKGRSDGSVIIDVPRHRIEHLWKIH